jgi:AsmA protein
MKKAIKWVAIVGGVFVAIIIFAALLIPIFVDVQKYKPEIEKKVSEATGRPFTVGGDLELSLFPWAGLSFSDLHLGNPPGFQEKDLLSVKSFDVRVRLIPLLSRDIRIKRFVLEGARIVLEKSKQGQGSWEGIGKPSGAAPPKPSKEKEKPVEGKPAPDLPIKTLAIGDFSITNGAVIWIDHVKGERSEISDVTLRLRDVSLDRPIHLAFSASLDGHPLSLEGDVGPVGKKPGEGTVPLDLSVKALRQLDVALTGEIVDPATRQQFDLALRVSPFSPRKLMTALGQVPPVTTADPKALNRLTLEARLKGDSRNISVSDGALDLDESRLNFSAKLKDFSKPVIAFDLNLDQIDLDRYLPSRGEKKAPEEKAETEPPKKKKTDYTSLRRLVLDGLVRVGKLKAQGARIQDVYLKVSGRNGRFHLDPFTLKLYQGDMKATGALDVQQDIPKSNVDLKAEGIKVGPLLKDLLDKDFLEGDLKAEMAVRTAGDDAQSIKKTLNGKGDLVFEDGAIIGFDLAGMVQNAKAAFGLAEKRGERPRTDFSELHSPFTLTDGVVETPETSLISPLLRVVAAGNADLVKETLDFRVEPKFVATLAGQGDMKERAGVTVPVLVTGSFSSPKFRPDLEGMLKQELEKGIPDPSELKKILKKEGEGEDKPKEVKEKLKGLLKDFTSGR